MDEYFSYAYGGPEFVQFGTAHLVTLALIVLIIALLCSIPFSDRHRKKLRTLIASALLVNELAWHIWHFSNGLWTVQTMLPLHLCNLLVLISAVTLLTRNQTGYEFLYFLGITGAAQVLITPGLGAWGFPHFLFFQTFISHGGIVLTAIYLTLGEGMGPSSGRALIRILFVGHIYAGIIFLLNPLLGSNYLFFAYKPPAATLLDFLGSWPWYVLSMIGIGAAQAVLLYLPFAWINRRKKLMSD